MESIINAQHITKTYGQIPAVDDLSIQVKAGDFFGFLGPNGAGKTTTIRMLTGILAPDHGTMTINGKDISKRQELSRVIGVLSESRGFYDWMTSEEYLSFFADLYSLADKKKTVTDLLDTVGLAGRKNTRIATYSRGI